MTSRQKHIKEAIQTIERMFSCNFCMHGRCGSLDFINYYHLNKACTFLKKKYPLINFPCYQFDAFSIREFLEKTHEPVFKICPAGFCEVAVPVLVRGWVDAVIFAGPFSADELPEKDYFFAPRYPGIHEHLRLPKLDKKKAESLKRLCLMLSDCITCELELTLPAKNGFKELVQQYIRLHYHLNIGLDDLAECMHLSKSRLSAKISATFNTSFRSLVNSERLNAARNFLKNSAFNTSEVAEKCGFSDNQYFHRVFKKMNGISPGQFRKRFCRTSSDED
ncbi:MAG: Xylose operon regulatory protein [Lentisphaerae bacterium ADurb.Bin242]|nr:MAG: Xylose operon regulatory protein [Lentisphaerae bacterium ADurb.Bin242]